MTPPTPSDLSARWQSLHLWLGLGLGVALGLLQLPVALAEHADALRPRPALFFVVAGLCVAGATCAGLIGLGWLGSRVVSRPWARRSVAALEALALSTLTVAHALGVLVRIEAGDYPSYAGYQMLGASPVQFVSQALSGYGTWLAAGAFAWAALACGLFALLVLQSDGSRPLRARVLLGAGLACAVVIGAAALSPLPLARATPELALIDSYARRPIPRPGLTRVGRPRSDQARWLRELGASRGPRPNVLLLMLESVPHDHLGYTGYPRDVSPNIDRLAARALRMTRAWSAATQSNYAQMAILSSLHPLRRSGLDTYQELDYPRELPHDVFHQLGYATATISSQNESWQGMRRFQSTATPNTFLDASSHPGPHIGEGLERKLPDHLTVDRALEWLNGVGERKFALYLNLQRTHFPYTLPPGVRGIFQPADPDPASFGFLGYPLADRQRALNRYDNALRYVDAQIGRIRDWLQERGKLDDTLWIVVADHGEAFHQHGLVAHGKSLYEVEARVPLFLHWPARLEPGAADVPVSTLDIMPTVLELLGLPPHPSYQGRSFANLRRREHDPTGIYLTLQGLRYADAVVCWPWKLIYESSHDRFELFDLARDPDEQRNLMAGDNPTARALGSLLLAHVQSQLRYHADLGAQRDHFAPPLLPCPAQLP